MFVFEQLKTKMTEWAQKEQKDNLVKILSWKSSKRAKDNEIENDTLNNVK